MSSTDELLNEVMDILNGRKAATAEVEVNMEEVEATIIAEELPSRPEPELVETDWAPRDDGTGESRDVRFSTLFWKPKHVPDHLVTEYRGYPTCAIPALYVPPVEVFEKLSLAIRLGLKMNMVGPTGSGKTLALEYFAAKTGRPYLRIEHNMEIDKAVVFGQTHINVDEEGRQSTDFVPGVLPESMKWPTLVTLDELTRATGYANVMYQRLLDRRELAMPELKGTVNGIITPVEGWVVTASDNTLGNGEDMDLYSASNVQDASFINRWDMVIEVDYLTAKQEETLIKGWDEYLSPTEVTQLAKFSKLMHDGFKKGEVTTAFSPRNLSAICKLTGAGIPLKDAIAMNFTNRVAKSEQSDVSESLRAVFGS